MSAILRASHTVPSLFSKGIEPDDLDKAGTAIARGLAHGLAAWRRALDSEADGAIARFMFGFCGSPIALFLACTPFLKAATLL